MFQTELSASAVEETVRSFENRVWRSGESDYFGSYIVSKETIPLDSSKSVVPTIEDILAGRSNVGESLKIKVWLDEMLPAGPACTGTMQLEILFRSNLDGGQQRWDHLYKWAMEVLLPALSAIAIMPTGCRS